MFGFFAKKKPANAVSLHIILSGLHCTSCAVNIDLTLEELPGVINSKTDYAKSTAVVDYEPDKTDPKTVIAEIEKLGYQAREV